MTSLPLEERRALLGDAAVSTPPLQRVELVDDEKPWERASREGWEGVIAKRRGSPYEHRRSKHWLKMKCEASQELVVGGFTDPQGARVGLGALLVGYYEGDDFVFAGKIGTGFDTRLLLDLRQRLDAARDRRHRRSRRPRACRSSARTGFARRSSCRSRFIEWTVQRQAAPSATARRPLRQDTRATSSREASRDHASREGPLSRRRDHQGRSRRVLRGHGAGDAAAPARTAGHDGAISRRHRQEGLLAEGRLEGISRLARARRSAEEGRRRPSSR